jgi:hypothetical protein
MLLRVFTALFLASAAAYAEEILNEPKPDTFGLYVSFDIDPMFAFGMGVTKDIPIGFLQRDLVLSADASIPMFLIDLKHFEINAAGRIGLFSLGPVSVANRLGVCAMITANDIFSGAELGVNESVLIGYLGENWHLAVEVEYDMNLLAYMAQTEEYKTLVYAGGKDGWYGGTGGRFKFGIQGGIAIIEGLSLNLRAGCTLTEKFNHYTIPFYVNLCTAYQF